MPEGPEIRRAADRLAQILHGQEVVSAHFTLPRLQRFERRLTGRVVTSVDTRGKAMLIHFDNGLTLYSHNQLYGVWFTAPRDRPPQTGRTLRVALHTVAHSALLYSATDIDVLTRRQLDAHPFLRHIGPDVLDPDLTAADIYARLDEARFKRRALGSLYLDQSFIAGIGNYLRSEILFVAGVHFACKPASLDSSARRRLARATLNISRRAYRTAGVTLTQTLAKSLRERRGTFQKSRFWVYRRAGQDCYRCATRIERITVSSRGLFFCPRCAGNGK